MHDPNPAGNQLINHNLLAHVVRYCVYNWLVLNQTNSMLEQISPLWDVYLENKKHGRNFNEP